MFTVLVLGPRARAAARRRSALLAPFVDRGDIALCEWDEDGSDTDLASAVPGLVDAIRGHPAWRAVVVEVADAAATAPAGSNPFDRMPTGAAFSFDAPSTDPLVRLGHLLLGYPNLPASGFEPVIRYREPGSLETGSWRPSSQGDDEARSFDAALHELGRTKVDVQVLFHAVPHGADVRGRHAAMVHRYEPHEQRPVELVYLGRRVAATPDGAGDIAELLREASGDDGEEFAQRNGFPASSRFAVYDLLPAHHSSHELDELRFWLTVLTVAINDLPPSTVQAEQLYRTTVDIDPASLADVLSAHTTRMTSVRDHLQSLLERPDRPPPVDGPRLPPPVATTVEFEAVGGGDLKVGLGGYGLAVRTGRSESVRWNEDWTRVRTVADEVIRRPRRILARAVDGARRAARAPLADGGEDPAAYDREDLVDAVATGLPGLTRLADASLLDRGRWQRALDEEERRVRTALTERPRLGTVQVVTGVALACWIGTSLPWLIAGFVRGFDDGMDATLVVLLVLGVLAVVIGIALLVLRTRLVLLLRSVNAHLRHLVEQVVQSAQRFSAHLSDIASHMRLQALLTAGAEARVADRARRREWMALRARLDEAIETERRVAASLGLRWTIRKTVEGLAEFDRAGADTHDDLFRLPVGEHQAAFNHSGERVRAPYDFVERLRVERLRAPVPDITAIG